MVFTIEDYRIIKRFLIFPRQIGREVRWLETVYISQRYSLREDYWYDLSFVTEKEYLEYKLNKGEKK